MQPTILITIDVEDWFQVENFKPWIPFETWDQRELRVERNVHRLLDLFDSVATSHRAGKVVHDIENTHVKTEELEIFRRRRIGCSHFHPENENEQIKNLQNPVNPVKKNKKKIQATFFVLGWIAERLPHLVREIHARGHEIASHGYNHNLCNQQSAAELKKELTNSKKLLEDITGSKVFGFRAPNFSIDDDTLKIVDDCGYLYDSSYNSFGLNNRYGQISLNGDSKHGIAHKISENFFELPISNIQVRYPLSYACPVKLFRKEHSEGNLTGGLSAVSSKRNDRNRFVLPWGGGGYFRLIPYRLFKHGVQSILKKDGAYVFYMHPWELDPEQPKIKKASLNYRFRHYTNLNKTRSKLTYLLESFQSCSFITCSEYLKQASKL